MDRQTTNAPTYPTGQPTSEQCKYVVAFDTFCSRAGGYRHALRESMRQDKHKKIMTHGVECLIKQGCPADHSFAVWACKPKDLDRVVDWVRGRSDMEQLAVYTDSPDVIVEKLRGNLHGQDIQMSVYPVGDDHPALID